jgi:hypothetical protein
VVIAMEVVISMEVVVAIEVAIAIEIVIAMEVVATTEEAMIRVRPELRRRPRAPHHRGGASEAGVHGRRRGERRIRRRDDEQRRGGDSEGNQHDRATLAPNQPTLAPTSYAPRRAAAMAGLSVRTGEQSEDDRCKDRCTAIGHH